MTISAVLIDDHPLFRKGIRTVLERIDDDLCFMGYERCEDALEELNASDTLDIVLLDLNLPGMNGLDGLCEIRAMIPACPIVIISADDDSETVRRAIDLGAKGYIPKSASADLIVAALQVVLAGGIYLPASIVETNSRSGAVMPAAEPGPLTARQVDVLTLLTRGLPNKLIARQLDISENTVRAHLASIFRILDVNNRTEACRAAINRGLIVIRRE